MNWERFFLIYTILSIPPMFIIFLDIIDRIRHRHLGSVRVSFVLMLVCFFASLVALFASTTNALELFASTTNALDLIYDDGDGFEFVVLMSLGYIVMTLLLIMMHNEKIIYMYEDNRIFLSLKLYKKYININDITRFNLSADYLDIYVNNKRIRYGNNFLVGTYEFDAFLKQYFKNKADIANN
ncbi:MAG: hypothetical protein ACI4GY_09680 [Acutalibacteraceae bacterium]